MALDAKVSAAEREMLFADAGELARPVFALTSPERTPGGVSATVYGLYWALVALSAEGPPSKFERAPHTLLE